MKKNYYKSISIHKTLYQLLKRLSVQIAAPEQLSIPKTITLLAEARELDIIIFNQQWWATNNK